MEKWLFFSFFFFVFTSHFYTYAKVAAGLGDRKCSGDARYWCGKT